MNVLFVTWDGPQVSYLEGLFLPMFQQLRTEGVRFHVLQFTWGNVDRVARTRAACEDSGTPYYKIPVWRRPVGLGALITALIGGLIIRKLVRQWSIDILMPRSTLPALAALVSLRRLRLPVIFDADGLPLDERVDFAGVNPSGFSHRMLRDIEAEMLRRANKVFARSARAVEILIARAGAGTSHKKFKVVGNGRPQDKFCPSDSAARNAVRRELGFEIAAPVLVYAGSLGEQYCIEEMFRLFKSVVSRRTNARLLILSPSRELAYSELTKWPELEEATTIFAVTPDEVPRYLACADLGLALRRSSFSMQAVAPIKIGEYLLCGLPVVATVGIGDTVGINKDIGFLTEKMDMVELEGVADWFCNWVLENREYSRNVCRSVGVNLYSINSCKDRYLSSIYDLFETIKK